MIVNGKVTIALGATLTLASTGGYVWNGSDAFTILANNGISPISGTFTGPNITNFLGSSLTAYANYVGGTGDDLILGPPLTTLQNWRKTWYGTTVNVGIAADSAVPYANGIPNLVAFAFLGPTQNPATATLIQLPQPQTSGGNFFYRFSEPVGVSGVTYLAEYKTSLTVGNWLPLTDSGAAPQHLFSLPLSSYPQLFVRLKVTAP